MGENAAGRRSEAAALRLGLDLGLTLIDTAEMYGEGGAEEVVADAISGRRAEVFLVSKFYPQNASRKGVGQACERSLRRLRTDYLDLYLLHWRGSIPFSETMEALRALKASGKIREYGVSNLDVDDMEEMCALPGGDAMATDQILYNLSRRGVEWDLLPWCRERSIPLMAYLLRHPDVMAIPKAATPQHVRENLGALEVTLTPEDLKELDRAFPPPTRKRSLEML
jgi:diketogulonate reductase-like aldo/keto reductase